MKQCFFCEEYTDEVKDYGKNGILIACNNCANIIEVIKNERKGINDNEHR